MATYQPAKKGAQWIGYIGLPSTASAGVFQSNPTIAAGDFKVSIDGGALNNLATLPTVTPGSSKMVKITLSTSEMNGDNITVICSDAAGAEWNDVIFNLQTAARQIDDLCFPTTSGRSLDVTATGEAGIDWANIGSPTTTVNLSGTSTLALEPTTAGRKLDVSVGGEAGLDWANIGSPTTVQNLSGTSTKAVEPTVAGRTLDVSATGEAGVDWANVGGQATAVNLSSTTIATVSGNVTGSVGSIGTGGITAASFAAGAIDATAIAANAIGSSELAQSARDAVADALLARNIAGGSSAGRIVSEALYILRNKVDIAAGNITVYATDDTTSSWTGTVTTTAGNPISQVDPA